MSARHDRRAAWTPGPDALRTLQLLADELAHGTDMLDRDLLAAVNAASTSTRPRTLNLYRRDVLDNLSERGYIAPGAERRTWRLREAARGELARIESGLHGRTLPAAAEEAAEPALQARLAAQVRNQPAGWADLVPPELRPMLTRGIIRPLMSAADRRPCVERAGGSEALQWPSRRGNRLYYRDGRVTTLDGGPIAP